MKRSFFTLIVLGLLCVSRAASAAVILSEGFNQATLPAGWSLSNATPVTFVTSSTYPTAVPYEGTHFVRFNSFSVSSGVRSQLASPSMSTVGKSDINVVFAWYRDTGYASNWDRVYVQYSIDGTTWADVAMYPRTNTVNGWTLQTCPLPADATNQPNLRIAFLFWSAYGNNCYLDAVQVKGTAPGEVDPPVNFSASAASKTQINLAWQANAAGDDVIVASNGVATFGVPANGTSYAVGTALPGGGVIIYKGNGLVYPCDNLTMDTRYYYSAWSVNAVTTYSPAVTANAQTFAPAIDSFPYLQDFNGAWPPSGWSVIDNLSAGGTWDLNTTWSRPNYAGGNGTCADADSDAFGDAMDTELRATFDFSGLTKPVLKFITSYNDYSSYDSARTQVSTNGGTTWVTLANWTVDIDPNGPGSNIVFNLEGFAGQPNVMLRFWYVSDWDWWWEVDNVYVYDKLPNVYLEPTKQSGVGYLGAAVPYRLSAENATGGGRDFNFQYDSIWPVNGPSSSGILGDGVTTNIVVSVTVPLTAYQGQACTTTVRAVSSDGTFTNTAQLITSCTWEKDFFYEAFTTWPNGWTNYYGGPQVGGWYRDAYYGAAAHGKFAGATNWLVSPAIDLTGPGLDSLELAFLFGCTADLVNVEGIYLSTGSRNPADGAFVKLADIESEALYWFWNYANLLAYVGSNPVYLGIAYLGPNDWQLVDEFQIAGAKVGIDNAMLAGPPTLPTITSYDSTLAVTGGMSYAGETGASGPAPFTTAELGFGPTGTVPNSATWTWFPAAYLGAGGDYDLYTAAPQVTIAGPLNYCYRFRRGTAAWVYGDLDGSTNGFNLDKAGVITVNMLPPQGALLRNQTIGLDWVIGPSSFVDPSNAPPIYWETADDLNLPYDAHIKSVRMGGIYWNAGRQGLEDGFWLRIYNNTVTNPGSMLYQQYVPGYACEQFLGVDGSGLNDYKYQVNLSAPFLAVAGNTYWISLQQETRNGTYWSLLDSSDAVRGLDACQTDASMVWSPVGGGGVDLGMEVYGDVTNAGFVAGMVRNADTLLPITDAQVMITNASYINSRLTMANGTYVTPAPAGTYDITVTKAGYLPATAAGVIVAVGQTNTQDFLLEGSQLFVSPTNVTRMMAAGQMVTNQLVLTNSGPLAVDTSLALANWGYTNVVLALKAASALAPAARFPIRIGAPSPRIKTGNYATRATTAAAAPTAVLGKTCYGVNIFQTSGAVTQLWQFTTTTPSTPTVTPIGPSSMIWGGDFIGGDYSQFYALTTGNSLIAINVVNGAVTTVGTATPSAGAQWSGMAAANGGTVYASANTATGAELYTINPATGAATLIGTITGASNIGGLAISPGGALYGVDLTADVLVSINKTSGAGTVIGALGMDTIYDSAMDYDDEHDILYLATCDADTANEDCVLVTVNPATGATNGYLGLLGNGLTQVTALGIVGASAPRWARLGTNALSIAAGAVANLDVIFDATVVSNPGTYTAELELSGTHVNPLAPVPLKMILGVGPIISAPALLDFGDVIVGETGGVDLVVGNIGVGVLTGETTGVTAPFGVLGAAGYGIPAGASVTQNLVFTPPLELAYTNTAVLTGGGGATVILVGVGIPEPAFAFGLLGVALLTRRRT